MVSRLVVPRQFLQSHPSTHSLGIPVAALHIVHFGHQQQGLVQVPWLGWQEQKTCSTTADAKCRKIDLFFFLYLFERKKSSLNERKLEQQCDLVEPKLDWLWDGLGSGWCSSGFWPGTVRIVSCPAKVWISVTGPCSPAGTPRAAPRPSPASRSHLHRGKMKDKKKNSSEPTLLG